MLQKYKKMRNKTKTDITYSSRKTLSIIKKNCLSN